MVHFFGIFAPAERKPGEAQQQFFADDPGPSAAERDADLLNGKAQPLPEHQLDDRDESYQVTRFVSLLSPPHF